MQCHGEQMHTSEVHDAKHTTRCNPKPGCNEWKAMATDSCHRANLPACFLREKEDVVLRWWQPM